MTTMAVIVRSLKKGYADYFNSVLLVSYLWAQKCFTGHMPLLENRAIWRFWRPLRVRLNFPPSFGVKESDFRFHILYQCFIRIYSRSAPVGKHSDETAPTLLECRCQVNIGTPKNGHPGCPYSRKYRHPDVHIYVNMGTRMPIFLVKKG